MFCTICQTFITPQKENHVFINKDGFSVCEHCARRVQNMIEGVSSGHMVNVFWGAGHINWTCWFTIREILRKYGIKEVLEFVIY